MEFRVLGFSVQGFSILGLVFRVVVEATIASRAYYCCYASLRLRPLQLLVLHWICSLASRIVVVVVVVSEHE